MSKISNRIGFLLGIALVLFLPVLLPQKAQASDRYTLIYRAGNVATFDVDYYENLSFDLGTGVSVDVTKNYVKFTVARGTDTEVLDQLETIVEQTLVVDDGYKVLAASTWGYASEDITSVTKNHDFTVDYGKLVNPCKYTIRYVNKESGEEIAPSKMSYGNVGDEISYTPLNIENYTAESSAGTLTLASSGSNTVTLYYAPVRTENVETQTNVEYIYKYSDGSSDSSSTSSSSSGSGSTSSNSASNSNGTSSASTNGTAANGTTEDTTVAENTTDASDVNTDVTEDTSDTTSDETTTIEDEDTATSASIEGNSWLVPLVVGIVFLVVLLVAVTYLWYRRRASIK